jgi:hypothetical protein
MNRFTKIVSARLAKVSSFSVSLGQLAGFTSGHMGYAKDLTESNEPPDPICS